MPPGGKIELVPLPPLPPVCGGSILVPREVAPKTGADPGGELSPPDRFKGLVAVAPRTGPIPRPIPVVPRPLLELCNSWNM